MVRSGFRIILGCMMVVYLGGCFPAKKTTKDDTPAYLASVYNPSRLSLHPDYSIFHESGGYSVLYIRAYPAELRFNQTNEESEYRALLSFNYHVIQLDDAGLNGAVVDSATITYKLKAQDEKRPAFFATLSIPVKEGKRYLLRLEARDLNRGSIGLEYLYVDKLNPYSAQNFKVISKFSGYPKFMRFFLPREEFNIRYRDSSVDSIQVEYFKFESELPRPPITATADYTMNYTIDTTFFFPLEDTIHYNFSKEGMYFAHIKEEQESGLTMFNFGGSFPEVKTPMELMEPLFYLTTLAEYRDLRKEPNLKLAVDNYWLRIGNNVEKSRELIRIYYNRVIYSNLYFTSNKEGWKTDQGMIFILFGPPSRIQMTGTGEKWYYFSKRKGNPVEFNFIRQPNVYSFQYMVWAKTSESQMYWNEAVRSWRNGKVYSMGS